MKTETHTQTTVTHSLMITFDDVVRLFNDGGIEVNDLDRIVLQVGVGYEDGSKPQNINFSKGKRCHFELTPWGM